MFNTYITIELSGWIFILYYKYKINININLKNP